MSTDAPPRTPMPDEPFYRRVQSRRWGGLLLIIGLVWLVFELTNRSAIFTLALVEEQATIPMQTFQVSQVVVRGLDDTVTLTQGEGEVSLMAVRHGFGWNSSAARSALKRVDIQAEQRGETLYVDVRHLGGIPFLFGRTPYADLQLALPPGVRLDVETVSGTIRSEALGVTGRLATVSGSVVVRHAAGDLQISSTSGEIQLADVGAGVQVETVSGDVQIEGARGDLRVHSISGDLDLDALQAAVLDLDTTSGDVAAIGSLSGQMRTISGDIDVELDPSSNLQLYVETTSGDIEHDLALREVQQDHRTLRGVLGDGQATLRITTTSGDVELE